MTFLKAEKLTHLILTVSGSDHSDFLLPLLKAYSQFQCNVLNSRITAMGNELITHFYIAGNWAGIAKLEASLPLFESKLNVKIFAKRTGAGPDESPRIPYNIQVVGPDRIGILFDIVQCLRKQDAHIDEIQSDQFKAPRTGHPMATLSLTVSVPENRAITCFRESILSYCEERNLDAYVEPYKLN
ncbi:MAG: ACT domain-containing protein [Pseudomonadota bacterium]